MHLLATFCFWSLWYSLLKLGQPHLCHFLHGHISSACLLFFVYFLWLSLLRARCLGTQHSFCQTSFYQCMIQEEFFHDCQRHGEQTFFLCFLNFWFLLVYLYDLYDILDQSMKLYWSTPFTRYFVYSSVPER